jgi:hypothetical protein
MVSVVLFAVLIPWRSLIRYVKHDGFLSFFCFIIGWLLACQAYGFRGSLRGLDSLAWAL